MYLVPVNIELLTGTVPVNKELWTGTVQINKLFPSLFLRSSSKIVNLYQRFATQKILTLLYYNERKCSL